eukprot:4216630-Pyramimonas_sp.AAC.1
MSLPPYDQTRYGPELLTQEWLGCPTYMSKDITTMLRHANHNKPFQIDQFTDRRVNIWSMKAQQTWAIPQPLEIFPGSGSMEIRRASRPFQRTIH